jgi:hypothetical protein
MWNSQEDLLLFVEMSHDLLQLPDNEKKDSFVSKK